jgi:C-terminal processing protease CtpA/Prc
VSGRAACPFSHAANTCVARAAVTAPHAELMGRYGKAEGTVIDVRCNVGGFLHDQPVTFLTGNRHSGLVTRNGVDQQTISVHPCG